MRNSRIYINARRHIYVCVRSVYKYTEIIKLRTYIYILQYIYAWLMHIIMSMYSELVIVLSYIRACFSDKIKHEME